MANIRLLLIVVLCICFSQRALTQAIMAKNEAQYVGTNTCTACHQQQYEQWRGSHHDLAMQKADDNSVLGDFNNATLTHYGVTSRFFKQDGSYFVNTQGPDGKFHNYQIVYTFGVEPLQQYLIAFPNGRYQALSIAWDSRSKQQGGQRWYHLHPDEAVAHTDSLHWTGAYYNWNSRCAKCHSTGLKKNYSLERNEYQTSWFEINVGCEGCHGPGSRHLNWAKSNTDFTPRSPFYTEQTSATENTKATLKNKGLVVDLADTVYWSFKEDSTVAASSFEGKSQIHVSSNQLETCAACHSRRSAITNHGLDNKHIDHKQNAQSSEFFLNHYQLQTLQENLYYPDGQILDEVYVYGSFIQSKMHQKGVKCSNCHNPHSLKTKAEGNNLCSQCHQAAVFDTPLHHHHVVGTPAAQCVNCHMPNTTYMVVDDRRDHSLRIPRPDLSDKLGTPNACNQCHQDQSPQWAADAVTGWYPNSTRNNEYHFGEALYAGQHNAANAVQLLTNLASNRTQPAMARASALALLRNYPTQQAYLSALEQLRDTNALIRVGAVRALEFLPPEQRWQVMSFVLDDSVKAVRLEAIRLLSAVPQNMLDKSQVAKLNNSIESYINAQLVNADMPAAHLNLGTIYVNQGLIDKAEQAYHHALLLDKNNIPAMMNLADLYRAKGQDKKGMELLLKAQKISPQAPFIHYTLGLALVRMQQKEKALSHLKQAAELAPDISHYSYTYALALDGLGKKEMAMARLLGAYERNPRDRDILYALATMNRDLQRFDQAIKYSEQLVEQFPHDRAAISLQQQLRKLVQ